VTRALNRTTADLSSYPDLVVIFWHETYFRSGQMESVYIDMPGTGLAKFAPVTPARGSLFSARRRLNMQERSGPPPGIPEEELYQQ